MHNSTYMFIKHMHIQTDTHVNVHIQISIQAHGFRWMYNKYVIISRGIAGAALVDMMYISGHCVPWEGHITGL